ncbi:hypothetical protein ACQJBY_026349 [Aegilops geniculata]
MLRAAEPVLTRTRTSCGESHTSTAGICVGGKLSEMAQPAVGSYCVTKGADSVIRVGARREGVRGSRRGGGDRCSTTSEPPCDAAATSLSHCRHHRNMRATFSALQVATDDTAPPTDEVDHVSVATVWVGLDGISGGRSGPEVRIGSKDGGRRGSERGNGWRATRGGGRVWWIWCNLEWGRAVGSGVAGMPGCPISGLDIGGVGQPERLRAV